MKTILSTQSPSQLETECLIVGVLDHGDKQNPQPELQTSDNAIRQTALDLIASKEITGKASETLLLHRPQGLKAKRILFVGGGKAKNFATSEMRKLAGTAVRFLKGKNIKSFALLAPDQGSAETAMPNTVSAMVEGAYVADFDPDYYRSDRKDQKVQEFTILLGEGTNSRRSNAPSKKDASSPNPRTSPATW